MKCTATDDHIEGPFYRPGSPETCDLYPQDSSGTELYFFGTVTNTECVPLSNVSIEVWHADNLGIYDNQNHPPKPNEFRCRGKMQTNISGSFVFRTVLPDNYPVPGENWIRVKHIHFKLYENSSQPLTTEIALLPDKYTDLDPLYNPNLAVNLISDITRPNAMRVEFNFVLKRVSIEGYKLAALKYFK